MKRHFIKDLMGDDSLSDYTQFMKQTKSINKKVKICFYSWIYNGKTYL